MAGMKYVLRWNKGGKELVLPIRIEKSVASDFGFKAHLVCDYCKEDSEIKQYYICNRCKRKYSRGDINLRMDKDTGVIFDDRQRKAFMEQQIKKEIVIEEEIDLDMDILLNIEFIESTIEIYSEELYNEYIAKIHKYLIKNKKALIATLGYRQKERGALIIPARNKLLLCLLRDYRLIKPSKAEEIEAIGNGLNEKLKAYSEDKSADMYLEFIQKIQSGEAIEVKVEKKKEEVKIEADWLEAVA